MISKNARVKDLKANALLELEITPLADEDLLGIWLYTAETWSINQADTYVDSLYSSFELLRAMPDVMRVRSELSRPVRLYPSSSHLIAYTFDAQRLLIVRVIGQRQDWQAILSK